MLVEQLEVTAGGSKSAVTSAGNVALIETTSPLLVNEAAGRHSASPPRNTANALASLISWVPSSSTTGATGAVSCAVAPMQHTTDETPTLAASARVDVMPAGSTCYVLPALIVTALFASISTVQVFLVVESQPDVAQMGTSLAKDGTVMVTTIGTTVPDGNNATGQLTLS